VKGCEQQTFSKMFNKLAFYQMTWSFHYTLRLIGEIGENAAKLSAKLLAVTKSDAYLGYLG
jgi:hypothetical protein